MDNKSLPDDLWLAARMIWENTDKITDRDLIDQLQSKFGDDAPKSNGTISKRRKKEEWVKNTLNTAAKRVEKVEPSKKNRNQKRGKKQNSSMKTNKAQNMEKLAWLEPKKDTINDIMDNVVIDAQGKAKIIKQYRKRYDNTGQIFDSAICITLDIPALAEAAYQAKQNIIDAANIDPANFKIGEQIDDIDELEKIAGQAMDRLQQAMMLSASLTETAKDIAAGLKVLSEVFMPLCGISSDDFKQSAQDIRMGAIEALGDIAEKEDRARDALDEKMFDRLKRFEEYAASGDFGRTDQQDDDDIDDVDYTAID